MNSISSQPNFFSAIHNSDAMSETERMKIAHKLRSPANKVDVVPVEQYILLSGVNFSDADYITILDK